MTNTTQLLINAGWVSVDEHEPPKGFRAEFTDGTGYVITSYPNEKLFTSKGFHWWRPIGSASAQSQENGACS